MTKFHQRERGVTLPELAVALGLITLVASLGVDSLAAAVARSQGRAAAVELAGLLRSARSQAATRRETIRVVFDMAGNAARVEPADGPGSIVQALSLHERGVALQDLSAGPSIVFYPSGRVATPTTITLENRRGMRWRLTVTITGRISIQ
jgi:Tfp pilus assembly protein FimT